MQVIAHVFPKIGRLPGASPALPEVVHDVPPAREHGVMEALAEVGIGVVVADMVPRVDPVRGDRGG
jgi:hypothetical protein